MTQGQVEAWEQQAAGVEPDDALAPVLGIYKALGYAALLWIVVLAVGLFVSVLA